MAEFDTRIVLAQWRAARPANSADAPGAQPAIGTVFGERHASRAQGSPSGRPERRHHGRRGPALQSKTGTAQAVVVSAGDVVHLR